MRTVETDVLVVGAGPVGLVTSALLAREGVEAITVTKHPTLHQTPRAIYTNQRTMEIFRDLGIEDEVRAVGTPIHQVGGNVWAVSFPGVELARLAAWGTGVNRKADYEAASPCSTVIAPQHVLEPVVLRCARAAGADVRFGQEVLGVEQDEEAVVARVLDRADGAEYRIRARYLVGADGGRSVVAKTAGFGYEGETGVLNWAANVWLEADLTRYCAHRPALMYCMYEPGKDFHSNTWICLRPWSEWVMSIIFSSDHGEPELTEETALEHARRVIADSGVDVQIKGISTWSVDKAMATEYRRGRVLLAGDSAHRHPPPNGLGSNTGVQDAFNLSWKLALVLSGRAGPDLLDTYDAERRPVGQVVVERAMRSIIEMEPMVQALGLDPGLTEEEGWARVRELAEPGGTGRLRRRNLRRALDLQQYHYNCHAIEAGQWYGSGAVVGADHRPRSDVDPQLYYRPSAAVGAPVPHAWVERDRTALSTVDIVGHGAFTLVTGIGGEDWVSAAEKVSAELGVPVRAVTVGYHHEYHDVYGDWAATREVDETGCLLVRPDRHIAWRSGTSVTDPAGALGGVMRELLARAESPAGR